MTIITVMVTNVRHVHVHYDERRLVNFNHSLSDQISLALMQLRIAL